MSYDILYTLGLRIERKKYIQHEREHQVKILKYHNSYIKKLIVVSFYNHVYG